MRFALSAVVLVVTSVQLPAQVTPRTYPAPGRLIDIGGRKLHLDCSGAGSPTVILSVGGGAYSIDWTLVQPKLAGTTRVCSYDRAGNAWSDPGPAHETVEQTVADLHALLRGAGEKGPYVLVGASIAGLFIRAYHHAYPAEVAGLVFANVSHRIGMNVKDKGGLIWELSEDELRSAYPLPASVRGSMPTKVGQPFDRLPAELQAVRLWLDQQQWESWDPAKSNAELILSWRKEFLREFEQAESGRLHPLGDLPVIVLSSADNADDRERKRNPDGTVSRNDAATGLTQLSSNSVYVHVPGSGHEIHLFQPDALVAALTRGVLAVRNRVPL